MTEPWRIRPATADDLDAIMAIERSVFVSDAWSRAIMRAELADRNGQYLVAERADGIAGYAGLRAPIGSPQADIQTIAVVPDARRTGLGRQLMRTMIAAARDRGAREILLEVRSDNPRARTLYESLGFVEIATRPKYYQPDGVDAVVMRLTLPMDAQAAR